jgi:hypothetical protein
MLIVSYPLTTFCLDDPGPDLDPSAPLLFLDDTGASDPTIAQGDITSRQIIPVGWVVRNMKLLMVLSLHVA